MSDGLLTGLAVAAGMAGFGVGLLAAGLAQLPAPAPRGGGWWRWALAGLVGVLWGLVTWRLAPAALWALPAYLALTAGGVVLAVIDARTHLLPNRLTGPTFVTVAAALAAASLATGAWPALGRGVAAAALVGAVFLGMALLRSGGMGMGDVKLVPTLALALGWLSWSAVLTGFALAYLLAGVAALIAVTFRGATRRTTLPFGPWLITGTMLALLAATPSP